MHFMHAIYIAEADRSMEDLRRLHAISVCELKI